jgi:lipoate-protein ligase B
MKNSVQLILPQVPQNYDVVENWQREVSESLRKHQNEALQYLWLGQFENVITLGRNALKKNILVSAEILEKSRTLVREINRGGDVTWHGPGQLVLYPILNLNLFKADLHWYLRSLEEVVIRCLKRCSLSPFRTEGKTGVWLEKEGKVKKIASMGVHVSRWISTHGLSLNVNPDLHYFDWINACNLNCRPGSIKDMLGDKAPSLEVVGDFLIQEFSEVFQCECLFEAVPA